jgi:hypothetical protein
VLSQLDITLAGTMIELDEMTNQSAAQDPQTRDTNGAQHSDHSEQSHADIENNLADDAT